MNRILAFLAILLSANCLLARDFSVSLGTWRIVYDQKTCAFAYEHQGKPVLNGVQPEASCRIDEREITLRPADFDNVQIENKDNGVCFVFSSKKGDSIGIFVDFSLYEDALLTRLTLTADREIASNYLAPLCITTPQSIEGGECRMLKVPFDNDDFVRYHYCRLDTTILSYEVTTIFDGRSRHGIVVGSVEHDHWKSGIEVTGEGGNTVARLKAYSGVSTKETRDVLPHGSLVGNKVSSAMFLIAESDDWRDGMELFASACDARQPGRKTWQGGTPIGWQSWGVMATKNNIYVDINVSDFYAQTLRQVGFAGENDLQIMSIDAWDNLSNEHKRYLTNHCAEQGQIVGTYRSPFSLWWGEKDNLERKLFDGRPQSADNFAIYQDGQDTYLAVINYTDKVLQGAIPFDFIGISSICLVKELWTGEERKQTSTLPYSVPAKDARIYRLTDKQQTTIDNNEKVPFHRDICHSGIQRARKDDVHSDVLQQDIPH